jgi:hypothetical protein
MKTAVPTRFALLSNDILTLAYALIVRTFCVVLLTLLAHARLYTERSLTGTEGEECASATASLYLRRPRAFAPGRETGISDGQPAARAANG